MNLGKSDKPEAEHIYTVWARIHQTGTVTKAFP